LNTVILDNGMIGKYDWIEVAAVKNSSRRNLEFPPIPASVCDIQLKCDFNNICI